VAYDVRALRAAEFPWADETTYLDHASIGPIPERTRLALDAFNYRRARPHLLTHDDLFGAFARARATVAQFLNVDAAEVALTTNTTYGLALAARGLPLAPGDVVLVSDREFPANMYPWRRLGDRGVTLEVLPCTPEGWPDEAQMLARLADPKVRCLAVSLTQFSNGYTVDLATLSRVTRANGQFLVVDAIQGLGQIPVDLRKTPVDVLSSGGQKWLLSPWGSGFMYVRRELIAALEPTIASWMAFEGTDDFSRLTDYRDVLRADARRFELITLPYQEFVGLATSLDLLLELGVDAIQAHLAELTQPLLEWARRRSVPVTSPTGAHASGITCVAPPRVAEAYKALRRAGVSLSHREGALRLAPHCYTSLAEIERVIAVLDPLV
jgi:cysteine desulfurase/selenocysteine lyase